MPAAAPAGRILVASVRDVVAGTTDATVLYHTSVRSTPYGVLTTHISILRLQLSKPSPEPFTLSVWVPRSSVRTHSVVPQSTAVRKGSYPPVGAAPIRPRGSKREKASPLKSGNAMPDAFRLSPFLPHGRDLPSRPPPHCPLGLGVFCSENCPTFNRSGTASG
jgi:hypothetical protein